jgi:CRP-like cAMP-binding protein
MDERTRPLFNYINTYAANGISADDFEHVQPYFQYKKYKKKQCFLQEGEICKYFGFVLKGAMKQYFVNEKGAEHVVQLAIENWWVGDRESYLLLTPTMYSIDAWEDTELLLISRPDVLKLTESCPAFVETVKMMDDRNSMANQRRITSVISGTAEKRYTDFVACYPNLAERFPQHIIASYLGITKDTLSRVKRHLYQKK